MSASQMKSTRMRIYVAGPFRSRERGGVKRNVETAMKVGLVLLKKGHNPYVPHLDYWMGKLARKEGIRLGVEGWMDYNIPWLLVSDAIFVIAPSPGANRERELAEQHGLKVFERLEDVPVVVEDDQWK